MILLDYAVHQINEMCIARGVSTYTYEDIKPLVSPFMVGNHAPEAFYLTVKYGVEGTGDILRSSISRAISHTVDNKHLSLVSSFLHLLFFYIWISTSV